MIATGLWRIVPSAWNTAFYVTELLKERVGIRSGAWDWRKRLGKYAIDPVLLRAGGSPASTLKESRRWCVAYDDGIAIVFRNLSKVGGLAPSGR